MTDLHAARIRHYLMNTYSDEELTILCFDYFRDVNTDFAEGMTKRRKIQLLLDHCQRYGIFPDLVAVLEQDRPDQYRKWFGRVAAEPGPVALPQGRDPELDFIGDATPVAQENRTHAGASTRKDIRDEAARHHILPFAWAGLTGLLLMISFAFGPSIIRILSLSVLTTTPALPTLTSTATRSVIISTPAFTAVPPILTSTLGIDSSRVSEKDGMVMVYVPAGDFLMGSTADDFYARPDEKPQHKVTLDAYWIDRIEVTNAMFDLFVTMTDYQTDAERIGESYVWSRDDKQDWGKVRGANWRHPRGPKSNIDGLSGHPVTHISRNDAQSYCRWAGRRLPTEAEWEKAARGPNGRLYPWGTIFECSLGSFTRLICGGDIQIVTVSADSKPSGASFYGALNMAGNVQEWVIDKYSDNYYVRSPGRNPTGPDEGDLYVLRGGSWRYGSDRVRTTARDFVGADHSGEDIGFRCAKSP